MGKMKVGLYYTPSIYAEGYIVFVFPFDVRSLAFCPVRGITSKFYVQELKWSISHQPLIRKHSYLDHRYPGGSAFIP